MCFPLTYNTLYRYNIHVHVSISQLDVICFQGLGLKTTYWLTGKAGLKLKVPTLEETEDSANIDGKAG